MVGMSLIGGNRCVVCVFGHLEGQVGGSGGTQEVRLDSIYFF